MVIRIYPLIRDQQRVEKLYPSLTLRGSSQGLQRYQRLCCTEGPDMSIFTSREDQLMLCIISADRKTCKDYSPRPKSKKIVQPRSHGHHQG